MARTRIDVAPTVMVWARTTAGYGVPEAAKRLAVKEQTLDKWEAGEVAPTVTQLRNAATVYRRPLAALLLPEPPDEESRPLADFRRRDLADDGLPSWSPALRAEVGRALAQRDVLLELLELAPDALRFRAEILRVPLTVEPEEAGEILRGALGLDEVPARVWRQPNGALNAVTAAAEALGVIVVQTQGVALSEMRGFSLAQDRFPVVGLNGADWPRPKLFTLLHELAHVALRAGGMCDLHEVRRGPLGEQDQLEHYCNQVAAAALMPARAFTQAWEMEDVDPGSAWPLPDLQRLAEPFGASSEAALLRMVTLRLTSWDAYWGHKPELDEAYQAARQAARQRQRETSGGPSFYIMKSRDLGHAYVASVLEAFDNRAISSLDVADYLDVRFDQLPALRGALRH